MEHACLREMQERVFVLLHTVCPLNASTGLHLVFQPSVLSPPLPRYVDLLPITYFAVTKRGTLAVDAPHLARQETGSEQT